MHAITVPLAVGTMAAILTAIEYILSTLSAFSVRAAMHGFWLIGLHRGGTATLDTRERLKQAFRKDIAGAVLGIWLVLGVALVESNLTEGVHLSQDPVNSTACVSMFGNFEPRRLKVDTPPYRTTVEPWVLKTAKILGCGKSGITSVGVGGATDSSGNKQNMSAPACADAPVYLRSRVIEAKLNAIKVESFYMQPQLPKSESFLIFPHNCIGMGTGITHLFTEKEGLGPCGDRGISHFFTSGTPTLQTTYLHYLNASRTLHDRICMQHGNKSVRTVSDNTVNACISGQTINGACLLNRAPEELIHTYRATNVSALFTGRDVKAQSYACPNVMVEQKYVFISPLFISKLNKRTEASLNVLVVLSASPIEGICEPTVNVLGQAALLYTADAWWREDTLSKYDKQTLYHAYMMAVSSSQFPLNHVAGTESATVNGSCYVRPVTAVTEIALDWRLFLLMSGIACSFLVITVGIVFRLIYTGESWKVGSAHWSLSHLLERLNTNEKKEPCLEVLAMPTKHPSSSTYRRASDASSESSPRVPFSFTSMIVSPRRSTEGQYQYLVRSPQAVVNTGEEYEKDGGT